MRKIKTWLALYLLVVFSSGGATQTDFDDIDKMLEAQFEDTDARLERQFRLVEEAIDRAYKGLTKKIEVNWGDDVVLPSKSAWVTYTQDLSVRTIIDFESGTLTFEAVTENAEPAEQELEKLNEAMRLASLLSEKNINESDIFLKAVENELEQASVLTNQTKLNKREPSSSPILNSVLDVPIPQFSFMQRTPTSDNSTNAAVVESNTNSVLEEFELATDQENVEIVVSENRSSLTDVDTNIIKGGYPDQNVENHNTQYAVVNNEEKSLFERSNDGNTALQIEKDSDNSNVSNEALVEEAQIEVNLAEKSEPHLVDLQEQAGGIVVDNVVITEPETTTESLKVTNNSELKEMKVENVFVPEQNIDVAVIHETKEKPQQKPVSDSQPLDQLKGSTFTKSIEPESENSVDKMDSSPEVVSAEKKTEDLEQQTANNIQDRTLSNKNAVDTDIVHVASVNAKGIDTAQSVAVPNKNHKETKNLVTEPGLNVQDSDIKIEQHKAIENKLDESRALDTSVSTQSVKVDGYETESSQHVELKRVENNGIKKFQVKLKFVNNFQKILIEENFDEIQRFSEKYKIPISTILAIIETESSFNPRATSPVPAFGLMQLVPRTAGIDAYNRVYGEKKVVSPEYLYDKTNNLELGTAYFDIVMNRYLKGIKNPVSRFYCAIASYNTGVGNLAKTFSGHKKIKSALLVINSMTEQEVLTFLLENLPAIETKNYLHKIIKRKNNYLHYDEKI